MIESILLVLITIWTFGGFFVFIVNWSTTLTLKAKAFVIFFGGPLMWVVIPFVYLYDFISENLFKPTLKRLNRK